jgi:hypothetical protein
MSTVTKTKKAALRESYNTRTPREQSSDTAGKIYAMRYAYFAAIADARDKGELTGDEFLFEMMRLSEMTAELTATEIDTVLSPEERKHLVSVAVGSHGFIDVCFEHARSMPSLLPSWLTLEKFAADRDEFETLNTLCVASARFGKQGADLLLKASDTAMRDARALYQSVQAAADNRVAGAETVLAELAPFYRSRGHKADEPSEGDVERDVRSLLHGTKEGRVVVENTKPHTTPGKRNVIDEVD